MKILNLTQHRATQEQLKDGVIEPTDNDKEVIKSYLTFNDIPSQKNIKIRAKALSDIAFKYNIEQGIQKVLIGGAPYLMSSLERSLLAKGLTPVYAFSKRVSKEITLPDGSVEKKMIFKHEGFISLNISDITKKEEI